MSREERRRKRIEKRNRRVYSKAWLNNDFSLSNGHGIDPYPSFEEWMELGGYVMPSWRRDLERKRRPTRPPIPQGTPVDLNNRAPVGDLVSDIAAEIAAEEHRQGLAYGKIWGHCGRCTDEIRRREFEEEEAKLRRRQARCRHRNTDEYEMHSLGGERLRVHEVCRDCGMERVVLGMTRILG